MTLVLVAETRFSPEASAVLQEVAQVVRCDSVESFSARLPEADAVLVALEIQLTRDLLDRARRLRVIASRTSQLRHLDVEEAKRRGIQVLSIEAGAPALRRTNSTAEEAMALALALLRNIPWAFDSVKAGHWERFRYGGHEVAGKTIGLVGFGRLGRMVAGYARAFEMRVIATDPHVEDTVIRAAGVEPVGLRDLLSRSDVVSLHCTWSDATRGLIGGEELALMRSGAVLVNTARGEITDESALLEALRSGALAGAAVDTLAGERPDGSHVRHNPLVEYARTHENLIILPHLGGATVEATERTQIYISRRLRDWLSENG